MTIDQRTQAVKGLNRAFRGCGNSGGRRKIASHLAILHCDYVPSRSSRVHRVDRMARPVELATGTDSVEGQAVQLGPYSGIRPLGEAPVDGGS